MNKPIKLEVLRKFARVLRLMRPFWRAMASVMLAGLVIQAAGMVIPYLSKLLIDRAYPAKDVSLMHVLVGFVIAVNVVTVVLRNTRGHFALRLSARLNNSMGLLFFNHVQHLPATFFDRNRTGQIMSRFQDITTSLNTVTSSFQTILMSGIYLVLVPPLLFIMNWELALLALLSVPFNVYISYKLGRATRPYLRQTAEGYAELRGVQIEIIDNIKTLKTMALEGHNYRRIDGLSADALKSQLKASRVGVCYGLSNGLIRALSTALYTLLGWQMIFSGRLTLGSFIAFTTYVGLLHSPINDFMTLFSEFQQSSISFDRMFEYFDKPTEQDPALARKAGREITFPVSGDIELRDVSFSYSEHKPVLTNVNIKIRKNTVNAVVGPSGSGKTSLLRLLTGLDKPTSGSILFDGRNTSDIPLSDLRRQVSVVWQEGGLIKGSVWDNLTLGAESPSRRRVEEAVRLCCLEELIEGLPEGYETEIAEKGASLSAGQRQRVAIARALIRQAPVLILDEATANVDVNTEMKILGNIFSRARGVTVIFVSHRPATASLADNIFMIDEGRVVEAGSHYELLSQNGTYYNLCEQSRVGMSEGVEALAAG
ncbi:MAG TPA: peptidase domain-containing ABC transporter [Pyrinomonadaceae bacterium]|jgi:ABC-type bacteriocin/lantibiotic exporter with double-glycine peptidase domain